MKTHLVSISASTPPLAGPARDHLCAAAAPAGPAGRALWAYGPHYHVSTTDNYQADLTIWVERDLEPLEQVTVSVQGIACELLRRQEPRQN